MGRVAGIGAANVMKETLWMRRFEELKLREGHSRDRNSMSKTGRLEMEPCVCDT